MQDAPLQEATACAQAAQKNRSGNNGNRILPRNESDQDSRIAVADDEGTANAPFARCNLRFFGEVAFHRKETPVLRLCPDTAKCGKHVAAVIRA